MENKGYIYCLVPSNNTDDVRYIGQTKGRVKRRESEHRNEWKRRSGRNNYKNNWVKSLIKNNLKPLLIIVDSVSIEDLDFWEVHYISLYKSWGFKLTNGTSGGDVNKTITVKAKQNMSRAMKLFHTSMPEDVKTNWKTNLSKSLENTQVTLYNKNTKELYNTYGSIRTCCEATGFNKGMLTKALYNSPIYMTNNNKTKLRWFYKGYICIREGDTLEAWEQRRLEHFTKINRKKYLE